MAISHHLRGELAEAEALYRHVLESRPDHSDALHLLAVTALLAGRAAEAAALSGRVRPPAPLAAGFHAALAEAYAQAGRRQQALEHLQLAAALAPDDGNRLHALGLALDEVGDHAGAVSWLERAVTAAPGLFAAHVDLGLAARATGDLSRAMNSWRRAAEIDPASPTPHFNMGTLFEASGRLVEAEACYRAALAVAPDHLGSRINLGGLLTRRQQPGEAVEILHQAAAMAPDKVEARNNLGLALHEQGALVSAEAEFQAALRLAPDLAETHANLGRLLIDRGDPDAAVARFRRALALKPDFASARSGLLSALPLCDRFGPVEIRREAEAWALRQPGPLPMPPEASPSPGSRLRLGYLSPDFRDHAAAYFIEAMLEGHDPDRVEAICYSDVRAPDAVTGRLRALAGGWRETSQMSDAELCALIRGDGIDVLIDCAAHTAGWRPAVFAARPAPVQVVVPLGSGFTTGMTVYDAFIGDHALLPEGAEAGFVEPLVRMDTVFLPFKPRQDWPEVAAPRPSGPPVLGCFGNPSRFSPGMIGLWRRILDALPEAELLVKHPLLAHPEALEVWRGNLSGLGGRCRVEGSSRGWAEAMDAYAGVDIALDTLPASGNSSTLIPLWMGVPVVSLRGASVTGRYGAAVLDGLRLGELVAGSEDRFVDLVVDLARDHSRLSGYRESLRGRLRASPFLDARRVMTEFDGILRRLAGRGE